MKTKIIYALLLLFLPLQPQTSKNIKEPLSDLKWGKFEEHPVRNIIKYAHWLKWPEQVIYASDISNFFDIDELVHLYSDEFPDLLLPYKKANEFEKRRLLPEIKARWEKMGKELLKYETLLVTTKKTTFGEYDFNNKGFGVIQPSNFYDGILHSTPIILHPKTDAILFPNFISVEETLAEQILNTDKKRELEQILVIKPIWGLKTPYHWDSFRLSGYGLECIAVYNIIVTKESRRVLNIIENPNILPVELKPDEISAYFEFQLKGTEYISFLFYPYNHYPFVVQDRDNKEMIIETNTNKSEITYGNLAKGYYKFYIKGGAKKQTLYFLKTDRIKLTNLIDSKLGFQNNLTEEKASKTANELLAQGSKLPDNETPFTKLIEWHGLVKISDTEMHGKATVERMCKIKYNTPRIMKLSGKFIFHQNSFGKWFIDKVDFHDPLGFCSPWIADVHQEVK